MLMIEWLKTNLSNRLHQAKDKFDLANKCNDTYTMAGMKHVKHELENILQDINDFEEKQWKEKIFLLQIKKEFANYNLNKEQSEKLVSFLIEQNFSIAHCKQLIEIFASSILVQLQKKED
jgi:hypothetical protein